MQSTQGLKWNSKIKGQEVVSKYSEGELSDRLGRYTQPDSIVLIDIADTVRKAPEKNIVWQSVVRPWRYWKNVDWICDFMFWGGQSILQKWNKEDVESFCLSYGEEVVLPHYEQSIREAWIKKGMTPLFDGVKETLKHYKMHGQKPVLLSRSFQEIVEYCQKELNVDEGYYRIENKCEKAVDIVKRTGAKRVLVFGDLPLDTKVGKTLQIKGLDVDMVQVCEKFDQKYFLRDATIYIPQNWKGLCSYLPRQ
jgi:ribosomal protein S10